MHEFQTIYQTLGEEKIKTLVHHFYKGVAGNAELLTLYPEDLKPAEERLFLFLQQVFGGPQIYSEQRGHPMLRKRHFQWEIGGDLRNAWLNCMFAAMEKIEIDQNTKEAMMRYFVQVANHMVNK
ncbi:truncated hemoglobin [Belliella baltica DSM 15883]|uniref:Truncated hemoglobin n=1 Tax=Belliella baltica (strain DSM 15883 / CIP 108006 / LMG 21964 / BA134) TaxID=866536 RepID=I3Z6W9_BELBD|nr:cyanoglobin [Belliella baltica]AFL84987.1 truncated hemoglobin [Belliella baltica DSM 15883]